MTNMPPISLILTFSLITGAITAYVAKEKKGRPPVFWFGIGFMLGLSALVALLFLPSLKKEKAIPAPSEPAALPLPQKLPMENTFWYYLTEKEEQKGPITFESLKRLYRDQEVAESSYVWNELMESWNTISGLPEYHAALEKEKA